MNFFAVQRKTFELGKNSSKWNFAVKARMKRAAHKIIFCLFIPFHLNPGNRSSTDFHSHPLDFFLSDFCIFLCNKFSTSFERIRSNNSCKKIKFMDFISHNDRSSCFCSLEVVKFIFLDSQISKSLRFLNGWCSKEHHH